jgi:adenosylmethionine-8-amino-7-oxononanoate aminotransferase
MIAMIGIGLIAIPIANGSTSLIPRPMGEERTTGGHPCRGPVAPVILHGMHPVRTADELSALAHRHLWMHFSRLGGYGPDTPVHVIARGDGCSLWDATGHRLLDGLSGLFTVQVGHGRPDLAEAARVQAETLDYFPLWTYAHPPAIELATRLATLAPGDLNRVFFTTGGSEAVESAWKLARQYFRAVGQGQRHKVIARRTAYHGTTLGALAITGVPALRTPFEPLTPGASHVSNTNRRRHPLADDEKAFMLALTDELEERIIFEGPDTVAAVFLEPVQNAGAASSHPRATSNGSARSATATACCSCPTR